MSNTGYIRLARIANTPGGMFGVLKLNELPFCVTLEPQERQNREFISCIPIGQYICKKYNSSTHESTWEVTMVPERTYILFHAGNVLNNTKGCILIAQHYGKLSGDLAIMNSGKTFKKFMDITHSYNELVLTITEAF